MRPLRAVILAANKRTGLRIRTESGLVANLPYNKMYYAGESIIVNYDFTKNKVVGILKEVIEDMEESTITEELKQEMLE